MADDWEQSGPGSGGWQSVPIAPDAEYIPPVGVPPTTPWVGQDGENSTIEEVPAGLPDEWYEQVSEPSTIEPAEYDVLPSDWIKQIDETSNMTQQEYEKFLLADALADRAEEIYNNSMSLHAQFEAWYYQIEVWHAEIIDVNLNVNAALAAITTMHAEVEADKVQTGLDRVQTGEDRAQTQIDRAVVQNDRILTENARADTLAYRDTTLLHRNAAEAARDAAIAARDITTAARDTTTLLRDETEDLRDSASGHRAAAQAAATDSIAARDLTLGYRDTANQHRIDAEAAAVAAQAYDPAPFNAHLANTANPHNVTPAQLGVSPGADVTEDKLTAAGVVAAVLSSTAYLWRSSTSGTGIHKMTINSFRDILKGYFDTLYQPINAILTATTASFTTALKTKLDGIETGATGDQTAGEIATLLGGHTFASSYINVRYPDDTHYGYIAGTNGSGARGFYLGYGNGGTVVNLVIDAADLLQISGGNVDFLAGVNIGMGAMGPTSSYTLRSSAPIAAGGGVIGYTFDQTKYGIVGYNNTYSFYGNGDIRVSLEISAGTDVVADRYVYGQYMNMSHAVGTRSSDTIFYSSTDNFIRKTNAAGMIAALGVVPDARTITAGNGLSGGGALTANRSFAVGQGTGITVGTTTVSVDATVWRDANMPSAAQLGSALAALTVGSLGSYCLAKRATAGSLAAGGVVAGSSLDYCSIEGDVSGGPGGSWRGMGYSHSGSSTNSSGTLWLRYA